MEIQINFSHSFLEVYKGAFGYYNGEKIDFSELR